MAIRASVNVSVTPELQRFVKGLVASGRYHSVSEVFREGLRLLEREERRQLLEKWFFEGLTTEEHARLPREVLDRARRSIAAKIDEGLTALDHGEASDGEEWFARWKARVVEQAHEAVKGRPRARPRA